MTCEWEQDGESWRCIRCGVIRRKQVVRRCEHATCLHRGDASRPVKVECCGGKNKMVDTYRCNSPDVSQRLCILSGTIAQEHERQLVAVCQGCEWSQP